MDALLESGKTSSHLTKAVLDGEVWSSRGFQSSACSRTVSAPSCLTSSWIRRLIPSSHTARLSQMAMFEERPDMHNDLQTSTLMANQCDTPVPENSRISKQDFYSSTFVTDPYCVALNSATSRSFDDAEALPFLKCEVRILPRSLPTVEALLPSYSQKVDERRTQPENRKPGTSSVCAGLSNEVKQIVYFSAEKRRKVSCSSIKCLDFASANPCMVSVAGSQSLRAGKSLSKQSMHKLESIREGAVGSMSKKPPHKPVMPNAMKSAPFLSVHPRRQTVNIKNVATAMEDRRNMGSGADAGGHCKEEQEFDNQMQGIHYFAKTESDNKIGCTKEIRIEQLHALGKTSNWNNFMGYKPCIRGAVAASEFSGSVSPAAGPSMPYSEGLDKASSSCSVTPEESGSGLPPASNEESRLPARHPILKKRSRDNDGHLAGASSNVVCGEKYVVKRESWMKRWSAVPQTPDLQSRSDANRGFQAFSGRSPCDNARIGRSQLSCENFALRSVQRTRHESSRYRSIKKVRSRLPSRQCHASETSSHFMKRLFAPSAAAMAIMGTTARDVHGAQLQGKCLSDSWAAIKSSTPSNVSIAQAETCKDLKTVSNSVKEFVPPLLLPRTRDL